MKYIGRELEVQRMKKSRLLPFFVFLLRQRFLVSWRDMVLCVATWVSSRRGCCVTKRVFPGHEGVWPSRMDYVTIKVLMSRQSGPRQGEAMSQQRKIVS